MCDFGTSRILQASLSLGKPTPTQKGTAQYLAIELVTTDDDGNPVSMQSKEADVWAFGMSIFVSIVTIREIPNC